MTDVRADQPSAEQPVLTVAANLVTRPRGLQETLLAWQPLQALTGIYGRIALGGHLDVTPQALVFRPHAVNLHTEVWRVPLSRVVSCQKRQRLSSALLVLTLDDGSTTELVCWKRDQVLQALEQVRREA